MQGAARGPEAAASERLAEVMREYDTVSGRLRQIAAQISVVDEVPVGEIPESHHHVAAAEIIADPTEPNDGHRAADTSEHDDPAEPGEVVDPQD